MALEGFKIAVVMQEFKAVLHDKSCNEAVDCFAHDQPLFTQL